MLGLNALRTNAIKNVLQKVEYVMLYLCMCVSVLRNMYPKLTNHFTCALLFSSYFSSFSTLSPMNMYYYFSPQRKKKINV